MSNMKLHYDETVLVLQKENSWLVDENIKLNNKVNELKKIIKEYENKETKAENSGS